MAEMFTRVEATLDKDWESKAGSKLSKILEDVEDFGVEIAFRKGHYVVCGTWEQVNQVRNHLLKTTQTPPVFPGFPFVEHNYRPPNRTEDHIRRKHDMYPGKIPNIFGGRSGGPRSKPRPQEFPADEEMVDVRAHEKVVNEASGSEASGRDGNEKIQELLVDSDVWDYIEASLSLELDQIEQFGAKIEKINDDSGMTKLRLSGEDGDIVSLVHDSLVTLHGDTWRKIVIETFQFHFNDENIVGVVTQSVNKHFPRVHIKKASTPDQYQFIGPAAETNHALQKFRQLATAISSRMEQQKPNESNIDDAVEVNRFFKNNSEGVRRGTPFCGVPTPRHQLERMSDDTEEQDEYRGDQVHGEYQNLGQHIDREEMSDDEHEEPHGKPRNEAREVVDPWPEANPKRSSKHEQAGPQLDEKYAANQDEEQSLKKLKNELSVTDEINVAKASPTDDVINQDISEVFQKTPKDSTELVQARQDIDDMFETDVIRREANSLDEVIKETNFTRRVHAEDKKYQSLKTGGHSASGGSGGRSKELLKKLKDEQLSAKKVSEVSDVLTGVKIPSRLKPDDSDVDKLAAVVAYEDVLDVTENRETKQCKALPNPVSQEVKKILQPEGGLFGTVIDQKSHLNGHEDFGTIIVNIQFSAGEQGNDQPQPGRAFLSMKMTAYLPASRDGKEASRLMQAAFKQRRLIKIEYRDGDGNLIPDEVEFKTELDGKNGYPDPDYVNRVLEQLSVKIG